LPGASRKCVFRSELKHSCSFFLPMLGKLAAQTALSAVNRGLSRPSNRWSCVSLALDLTQIDD
jgi:hypothetical protein